MKEKKTKEKKPKNGFALRLICAIIYLFAAVGLLLGSAYFYSQNHKNTFIEWFFNDYWSSNLKFSNKDIVYQESDKQYVESDWWDFNFDQDSKSLNARYEVPEKHNEEKYALAQDGIDDGRATLLNGAGGQIIIRYGGQNQSFAGFLYENQDWSEFYRSDIDGDVNDGNNFVEVKIKGTGDFILSVRYPQNNEDRYDYEKYVTESYKLTADSETNRTATFTGENGNAVKVKYGNYGLSDWFNDFDDWTNKNWGSYDINYEDGQDLPNYAQIMCYPENVEILFDFTLTDVSYETETYKYLSEDAAAKTITLENAASEKMTVCYGDCYQYNDYIYYDGWSGYGGGKESFIVLLVFGIFSAVLTVLQTIGAFAGRKRKGGNNLCIFTGIFMAPALLGLLSFFGGWYGNRALDYKYPEKAKKLGSGFGYRLTFAIMILLFAIGFSLGFGLPFMLYSGMSFIEIFLIAFLPGILIGALGIALIIGAAAGKKHKWGNVLHIVFGALTCPGYIGLFALVGGIKGNRYIDERPAEAIIENESVDTVLSEAGAVAAQSVSSELVKGNSVEEARNRVLTDYPIDYENKPAVSRLLDFDNRENLVLENEDGTSYEFHQLYVTVYKQNIYALTQTVGLDGDELVVFRVDYENDLFHIERDENICEGILEEYRQAVKAMEEEEEETVEYIQPKTSPKAKKGITIAATVSYGLLLLMGILLASVPAMSGLFSGMGICAAVSERAYGITIGVMWVTLAMGAGWLFVSISPWNAGKKGKIIIAAVSTALLVAMNVVFFIVIYSVKLEISIDALDKIRDAKELERWLALAEKGEALPVKDFFEGEDKWFIPVSTVFASLAIIVCHALTFFRINPNKIKARKPQKNGDGIFAIIKHVMASIIYGLLCIAKFILAFKERLPEVFVLVAVILLTWLAHFVSFVIAILCIALAIGVVVMYFAGVISLGFPEPASGKTEYYFINDMGCRQTVYSSDGKNFYNIDGSYAGSSQNGKYIKVD